MLAYPQKRRRKGLDMKAYVATRSKNPEYALDVGIMIEACSMGPDPLEDAIRCAENETMVTGEETYVLEVNLKVVRSLRIFKCVDVHVHS